MFSHIAIKVFENFSSSLFIKAQYPTLKLIYFSQFIILQYFKSALLFGKTIKPKIIVKNILWKIPNTGTTDGN